MKDLTVPLKSATTVGLVALGMLIFNPPAFSQTTLSPGVQGVLQQPFVPGANLPAMGYGYGPGYFDIITDIPPGLNRYYPPGPLLETQAIQYEFHGPIVPSGPLIQWEDNGNMVQNPSGTFTSAVNGGDSTWISTTPGNNSIAANYDTMTPTSSVVGPSTTSTTTSVMGNQGVNTSVTTTQSPTYNLTPSGTVVNTGGQTVVTNTSTNMPTQVDYRTGSVVTFNQAVSGTDPNALAPVVPCWRQCNGATGWFGHHHNTGCNVAPVYTQPVRGYNDCSGSTMMTTPTTSSNTVIMNQGVRGYDGSTNIMPEGTPMYTTTPGVYTNVNTNMTPGSSVPGY